MLFACCFKLSYMHSWLACSNSWQPVSSLMTLQSQFVWVWVCVHVPVLCFVCVFVFPTFSLWGCGGLRWESVLAPVSCTVDLHYQESLQWNQVNIFEPHLQLMNNATAWLAGHQSNLGKQHKYCSQEHRHRHFIRFPMSRGKLTSMQHSAKKSSGSKRTERCPLNASLNHTAQYSGHYLFYAPTDENDIHAIHTTSTQVCCN